MNNLKIVTQIEEVLADIGDPNCKMIEPYVVGEQDTLSPWLVDCTCLLYTSPSPRDVEESRMPSSA